MEMTSCLLCSKLRFVEALDKKNLDHTAKAFHLTKTQNNCYETLFLSSAIFLIRSSSTSYLMQLFSINSSVMLSGLDLISAMHLAITSDDSFNVLFMLGQI